MDATTLAVNEEIQFVNECQTLLRDLGVEATVAMGASHSWREFLAGIELPGAVGSQDRIKVVVALVPMMRYWDNNVQLPRWHGKSRQACVYRMMRVQLSSWDIPRGGTLKLEAHRTWAVVMSRVLRLYQYMEGWGPGGEALSPLDSVPRITRQFVLMGSVDGRGSFAEQLALHWPTISSTFLQYWPLMQKKGRGLRAKPAKLTWDAFCGWPVSACYKGMEKVLPRDFLAAKGRVADLPKPRPSPRKKTPTQRKRSRNEAASVEEEVVAGAQSVKNMRADESGRAFSMSTSQSSPLFTVKEPTISQGGPSEYAWRAVPADSWADLEHLCELPIAHLSAHTDTWPMAVRVAMRPVLRSARADVLRRVLRDCGRRRGGDPERIRTMRHVFRDSVGSLFSSALTCYKDHPTEVAVRVGRTMRQFLRAASRFYGPGTVDYPSEEEDVLDTGEVEALPVAVLPLTPLAVPMMDTTSMSTMSLEGLGELGVLWPYVGEDDGREDEEPWEELALGASPDGLDAVMARGAGSEVATDSEWDRSPDGKDEMGAGESKGNSPASAEELFASMQMGGPERRARVCRQLELSQAGMAGDGGTARDAGTVAASPAQERALLGQGVDSGRSSIGTPTPPELRYGPQARPGYDHMWLSPGTVLGPASPDDASLATPPVALPVVVEMNETSGAVAAAEMGTATASPVALSAAWVGPDERSMVDEQGRVWVRSDPTLAPML
jgi:hypothetical protein